MDDVLKPYLNCLTCNKEFSTRLDRSPIIRNGIIQCFTCSSSLKNLSQYTGKNYEPPLQYRVLIDILDFSDSPARWLICLQDTTFVLRNPFRCPQCASIYSQQQKGVVLACGHAICEPCHFDESDCTKCEPQEAGPSGTSEEPKKKKDIQPQSIQTQFNDFIEAIREMGRANRELLLVKEESSGKKKVIKRATTKRKYPVPLKKRKYQPSIEEKEEKPAKFEDLPVLYEENLFPCQESEKSQMDLAVNMLISPLNLSDDVVAIDDDEEISIIAVKCASDSGAITVSSNPLNTISPSMVMAGSRVLPPNLDDATGTVECSECERITDTNDVFLCTDCHDKMLCSLCMFRFHQKNNHTVRELMQDKINSLICSTKNYVNYQCETNIQMIVQETALIRELQLLPNAFSHALERVNNSPCLEDAKSGLHLITKLSANLQTFAKEFYPELKRFNRRIRKIIKDINEHYPRDESSPKLDGPSTSGNLQSTLPPFPIVDLNVENTTETP